MRLCRAMRGAFADELKFGAASQGQRPVSVQQFPVCHLGQACKNTYSLEALMWRAVKPAIWWCSGTGKASVLCLMVGYVYFKRWGVPLL